jgi:hypothetical protein
MGGTFDINPNNNLDLRGNAVVTITEADRVFDAIVEVLGVTADPGEKESTPVASRQAIRPLEILLAEDTAGGGHTWKLVDDQPWRRVYVVLGKDAPVPFKRAE